MTRTSNPQSRLAALLDALERELLAAQTDEMRDAWHRTGRAHRATKESMMTPTPEEVAVRMARFRDMLDTAFRRCRFT